ncbi:hypothetical protein BN7_6458 [Wickerhamomyces ciferrii]|uniref:Uncharacterized protein n=1 Tax=Wickerhamomyces ciferrii (strain ATCC 14091 / BCRC 22168 / CBS 111 / JCM 3599 / NBRC 0793 / NRRL Y-1031 F-60-10) TaxID=1206466 RepID=K0KUK2_WICCF|nr:uncharacterized protein BN7_6458 [Wickerhamomyces ciferrii]CCH46856.1 hypothetical protein BN7_6458 [Wickerhamomyces ciferrii]
MIIEKSGYRIEISAELYVKPKHRAAEHIGIDNLLLAKSPKHFKIDHETFNNFYIDKKKHKLISIYKEIPEPSKELILNHKRIVIKWRKVNESSKSIFGSSGPKKTCQVEFYLIPGYNDSLEDFLINILSDLNRNFENNIDIPAFLNTESFGNGLDIIEEKKFLMNIFHEKKNDPLPLGIILKSLISYIMSKEYDMFDSYDHLVKAYEFNYANQLKLMVIWGENIKTFKTYKIILEQLNYMISNDLMSESPNDCLITLIPGYLNYNINGNNDELPPSYGSSVLK